MKLTILVNSLEMKSLIIIQNYQLKVEHTT